MPRYIDAEALIYELKILKEFWGFTFTADGIDEAIEKVEEAPTAKVVSMPFEIGDTIYRVCSKGTRQRSHVKKYKVSKTNFVSELENFGKTVFLTRKEAERVANEKCTDR